MKKEGELWRAASRLVNDCRHGVLTTADAQGMPHAAWMNALTDSEFDEVVTITAPDTQKVANIRKNPQVEWMFVSPSMETVVYTSGIAEVLQGPVAEKYWNEMPGKHHSYFWRYVDSEDFRDFTVIRMRVEKIVYCRPQGYMKTIVGKGD